MTVVTAALAYGYTCHLSSGLFLKKSARHATAGPELKDVAGHQPETVPQEDAGAPDVRSGELLPRGLGGVGGSPQGREPLKEWAWPGEESGGRGLER